MVSQASPNRPRSRRSTPTYAVLSIEDALLTVRIVGQPRVEVPQLIGPAALNTFAATPSHTILSFQVQGL